MHDKELDDFYCHQLCDLEDMAIEVVNEVAFGQSNYTKYHMLSREVPSSPKNKSMNLIYTFTSREWMRVSKIDERLKGQCNRASGIFELWFKEYLKTDRGTYNWPMGAEIKVVHGEMKHCRHIPVEHWTAEHTMIMVKSGSMVYWVDCSNWQFQSFLRFDEPVYVSIDKPWWFYPDYKNPTFSKTGRWINKHIRFRVKMDDDLLHELGIIEILQYKFHRNICKRIQRRNCNEKE